MVSLVLSALALLQSVPAVQGYFHLPPPYHLSTPYQEHSTSQRWELKSDDVDLSHKNAHFSVIHRLMNHMHRKL